MLVAPALFVFEKFILKFYDTYYKKSPELNQFFCNLKATELDPTYIQTNAFYKKGIFFVNIS